MPLKLFNSLTRRKEVFKPIRDKKVGLYTCGLTVYNYAHLGNLRTYIFEDILKRVLLYNGYRVKHVMNITDVGHLTSDADLGKDKVEEAAKKEKKTAWQIAQFYTAAFKKNLKDLNIIPPNHWVKASQTIKDQIELIKKLEKNGFTYRTSDGLYFDTSKLPSYGKLARLKKEEIRPGIRVEMKEKRNPTDFALWKFSPPGVKRQMEWSSPWGVGFPGWHTECVAMSIKNLGIPFDIHCGGIDHLSIHHPNEMAQAEAAYQKPLAYYWLHGEFLLLDQEKMAKSTGRFITLQEIIDRGYHPLSLRYLCLTTHWQSPLSFSWQSLDSAQNALNNLYENMSFCLKPGKVIQAVRKNFLMAINDNLDLPKALALSWNLIKERRYSLADKIATLINFDKIFGLKLKEIQEKAQKIPRQVKKLISQREKLRKEKQWSAADEIRSKIKNFGYQIDDTPVGPLIKKLF
ncbi:MAG: cysteine--tRNA ligase [Patescibacteria group bacterium]|nr:cysteine--tRNA ligase [Patescibacteria group bacterium]